MLYDILIGTVKPLPPPHCIRKNNLFDEADLRAAWAGLMSAPARFLGHNAELSGATLAERPTQTPGYASALKTEE